MEKSSTQWFFSLAFPACAGLPGLLLAWAFLYFHLGRWDLVRDITGIFWFVLALQLLYELSARQQGGGLRAFARYFTLGIKLLVALLGHGFFFLSIAFSQMQGPKAVICIGILLLCALGNIALSVRELRLGRRITS